MRTAQELFDTAAKHLMTQGARAKTGTHCAYRSKDGLKCAVGCLIDDAHYAPLLERKNVEKLLTSDRAREVLGEELVAEFKKNIWLLTELQDVHDGALPETWHAQLGHLAIRHGLSLMVLDDFQPIAA